MSKQDEFQREERYIVLKLKHLSESDQEQIRATLNRYSWNRALTECVVVESDWPIYETVWKMIEAQWRMGQIPECSPGNEDDAKFDTQDEKWMPEVGEHVEFKLGFYGWIGGKVVGFDNNVVLIKHNDGYDGINLCNVRPVKTEAEKWRGELIKTMRLDIVSLWEQEGKKCPINDFHLSKYLIKQSWIKPKPLTGDAIESLIDKHQNECETLCSFEFARMIEGYIRGETL